MKTIRLTDEQYEQVLEAISFAETWANESGIIARINGTLLCDYESEDFSKLYDVITGRDDER